MEHLPNVIQTNQGIPTLLATIAIALSLQLVMQVWKFIFGLAKKKYEVSEKAIIDMTSELKTNTRALEKVCTRMESVEEDLVIVGRELPKVKVDIRRAFAAMKYMAGDDWSEIRKKLNEEEIDL